VLLKSTPIKYRTLRVDKGPMFLRKLAGREEPSSNTSSRPLSKPWGTDQINPLMKVIYYKYHIVLGTKTVTDLFQSV